MQSTFVDEPAGARSSDHAVSGTKLYRLAGGVVFELSGTPAQWTQISNLASFAGPAATIFTGGANLYATFGIGAVFRYDGVPMQWTRLSDLGSGYAATNTELYALTQARDAVREFTGTPMQWTTIGPRAARIFAGGTVSTSSIQAPPTSSGTTTNHSAGRESAAPAAISPATDSKLYGLKPLRDAVWEFTGTPMQWTQIRGPAARLLAGGGSLYATQLNARNLFRYAARPPDPARTSDTCIARLRHSRTGSHRGDLPKSRCDRAASEREANGDPEPPRSASEAMDQASTMQLRQVPGQSCVISFQD